MPRFDWQNTDLFYVNLDNRQDRDLHMQRELALAGLSATRFNAVRPDAWVGPEHKVHAMRRRTPGAIGCHLSQMMVIRKAVESGRNVCVMEDDLLFALDIHDRLKYVEDHLDALDPNWQVFSLGACFHIPAEWHKNDHLRRDVEPTSDPHILRIYGSWFTWAYVVRAEAASDVLYHLYDNMQHSWGIDHNFILLGDKLRNYCFVPGMTFQIDGRSSIGSGMTMFSEFMKLGPWVFTKRMSDFDPVGFDWTGGAK
jgi:GR25 family glycosyltransferase involved in LPS biosynthesis